MTRALRSVALGAVVFAVLVTGGLTVAQKAPPGPVKGSAELKKRAKDAEKHVKRMREILRAAFAKKQEARSDQDFDKLNCVNQALGALKGLMRLTEQNLNALRDASANGRWRRVEHELVKVEIAFRKMEELDGRVRTCGRPVGGGDIDGKPLIGIIRDEDLPTEDPVEGLLAITAAGERPPSASPFF